MEPMEAIMQIWNVWVGFGTVFLLAMTPVVLAVVFGFFIGED